MNDTISLLKPVPDSFLSVLADDQKKFFFTVGFNFCFGLTMSSFLTLQTKYLQLKEDPSNA